MSSSGKVSLVTGSARGLGLAVARHLRARGDAVHVVYRTDNARAAELRAEFGACAHRADLLVPADAAGLVGAVVGERDRLDCLVHCVGEYVSGPLEGTSHADVVRMWRSNAESAFLAFSAARQWLRAARGSAVFFGASGLNGLRGRRETAAYAAAKSALLVLLRGWAVEEAAHGVTVNMVSPGLIPHDAAHPDTHDAERQEKSPMGVGRPEDIARAVAFLCSDDARHTTGTDLLVTGGWML
jgi:NAD(P)-dependent dehydrogenase (short-subunit alcohol dehydrogenase family)